MLLKIVGLCMAFAVQSSFAQFPSLSSTGLYSDIKNFTISNDVRPYKVQYPLWSDGTLKERWVQLPAHSQIDSNDVNWWSFPEGTKIWKQFAYKKNGILKRIETRFLHRTTVSWQMKTYLWNADQTDALDSLGVERKNYVHLGDGVYHHIPSKDMCMTCHSDSKGITPVLGFSALQLAHNEEGLNLTRLQELKLLTHPMPNKVEIKSLTTTGRRAMGLMHGNCAHCHNPRGIESELSLNLKHDVLNTEPKSENAYATTVSQDSRYTFPDYEVSFKRILPGDPEKSTLYRRVKASGHLDPYHSEKMPPGNFGDMSVNPELVNGLREWITALVPKKINVPKKGSNKLFHLNESAQLRK